MPTDPQPFTEADVQLGIATVARVWNERAGMPAAMEATLAQTTFGRDVTEAVLSALAEAGRLVPDGAERVWGVSMGPGRLPAFCEDEHEARRLAYLPTRKVFSRAAGPWVAADSTP